MDPITCNAKLMLRFYQDALYLISLVFTVSALGCLCGYALLVCIQCYPGSHRRIKVVPRTAPKPLLAELETDYSNTFQLPRVSQSPLRAPGSAIPLLSARKAPSAS